ncbi:MAG: pyrimidine-nucleoside phosphorylase [Clostridia bacterium]|nr:pyrimidine-nucleoside phosphorylase [Clostridia bacterium]
MRIVDIIKKKRNGNKLNKNEIDFFINGYINGEIYDYQASALLMAILLKGMDNEETTNLTFAIRDSGEKLDFSKIDGVRVDKHSTGGVGDKTSLIVAPIVASLGVKVAKMSGRGLGHTGGTVDKLESITGYKTELSNEEFIKQVNDIGISIVGQSANLAPADKKLYALRDVTGTVESLPLVVSSIMGKKLCADDDVIVLDIKCGSGAICKTVDESKELASLMVDIGKKAGKKMLALITDMDKPLGYAIGNSLEVVEAIETLKGNGPKDLTEICVILASNMLYLAGKGSLKECETAVRKSISDGSALNKLVELVDRQGGDKNLILNPNNFEKAKYKCEIYAESNGYITSIDTEGYGNASLMLGAGRNSLKDKIDYTAGIILNKKTGDSVNKGDLIATLYSNTNSFENAKNLFINSTVISDVKPGEKPLVLDIVK